MADDKSPFKRRGASALGDGAARFDSLARELKARQIEQSQGLQSTAYVPSAVSPDEEWAKSFMTQGIGPRPELSRLGAFAPPLQMPGISFDFTPPPAVSPKPGMPALDAPATIGLHVRKPEPRRSWLGRLLRRKSLSFE